MAPVLKAGLPRIWSARGDLPRPRLYENAGDPEMNEPLVLPSASSQGKGSYSLCLHWTMSNASQKAFSRPRLPSGSNTFYGSLWPPAQDLNQLYQAVLCLLSGSCLCSEPLPQWVSQWKSLSHIRLFVTPMDYTVHGILQARILVWVSLSLLPGIFLTQGSPTLQVASLSGEPQGKPKNSGVGSLFLLQGIFPTQELNWGLLHCRWILYQLSYQGSPEPLPQPSFISHSCPTLTWFPGLTEPPSWPVNTLHSSWPFGLKPASPSTSHWNLTHPLTSPACRKPSLATLRSALMFLSSLFS